MRKKIIAIAITLPIVLSLGISTLLYTQHLSIQYREMVRRAEEYAYAGDMQAAQRALTEVATQWERMEPLLQIWVCHAETDTVTWHFKGMQVGLTIGDEPLTHDHAAALIEALEHLHHRDDLTWSNIL